VYVRVACGAKRIRGCALGPVVDPEHAGDDPVELRRHGQRALPPSVAGARGRLEHPLQLCLERGADRVDAASQADRSARALRRDDLESVPGGELGDRAEVVVLGAGAAYVDGDLDLLRAVDVAHPRVGGLEPSLAAWDCLAVCQRIVSLKVPVPPYHLRRRR
jgi:hypothetical protein